MGIHFIRRSRIIARAAGPLCILALAALALFVTAPKNDDFWWTDAPTHAMNGALLHDYLSGFDFTSPLAFARNYYLHYPALSITLYPPLVAAAEAVVFFIAGVSHYSAQLTVALFGLLLAVSTYNAARAAFAPAAAAGAALLFLSLPDVALWSRQVMLEIPALALLSAAAAAFLRFLEEGNAKRLYFSVLLLCSAVYAKQTAVFAAGAFAATLLFDQGWAALRRRSTWIAAALAVLLLAPLAVFILLFDPFHVDIARGLGAEHDSKSAITALTFYLAALPGITGPLPLAATIVYLGLVGWKGWVSAQERRLGTLMIAWFLADYVFLLPIAHRETRYGIFLALPIAIVAISFIVRLGRRRFAPGVALTTGIVAFVATLVNETPPRVAGYDAIAAFVLAHAEKDSVVLFHGFRSQNLVFALRAQSSLPKVFLLRSEKVLLDYRITRGYGVNDRGFSRSDVENLVDRLGIVYVVFQPDFWVDLPSMGALQDLVYSERFTKVAEFPIAANIPTNEKTMLVFRNERPTHPVHPDIDLSMPLIGGKISGQY